MYFFVALVLLGTFASGVDVQTQQGNEIKDVFPVTSPVDNDFWIRYLLAIRLAQLNQQFLRPQSEFPYNPLNPYSLRPPKPNCRVVGEPCTYHDDCCSNACLSYLGKCVSG